MIICNVFEPTSESGDNEDIAGNGDTYLGSGVQQVQFLGIVEGETLLHLTAKILSECKIFLIQSLYNNNKTIIFCKFILNARMLPMKDLS